MQKGNLLVYKPKPTHQASFIFCFHTGANPGSTIGSFYQPSPYTMSTASPHQPKPKAIIFDLLTALLDSWSVWDSSIPPSHQSTHTGLIWRKRYLELTYSCGAYVPYKSLVQQAATDVGLPAFAAQTLLERWDTMKPWEEVPDVLARLSRRGYKIGVVTNCSDVLGLWAVKIVEDTVAKGHNSTPEQRPHEQTKTSPRTNAGSEVPKFEFDAVVTAEGSGFYKPHAKPYEDLLHKLGVKAEEALFVAGSPADVPGAKGVGMRVVWHNRVGLQRKWEEGCGPEREGTTLEEVLSGVQVGP